MTSFVQYPGLTFVEKNQTIFVTITVAISLLGGGIFFFLLWDFFDSDAVLQKKRSKARDGDEEMTKDGELVKRSTRSVEVRTIQGFFNSFVPDEFKPVRC